MAKRYFERRSLASELGTSLNTLNWNIGQVREGYQSEEEIQPPLVAIVFLPSNYLELQLGRSLTSDKTYIRRIQIDCYMESEPRAMSICDDIMDFLDLMFIEIKDPNDMLLGHLYVPDSESISSDTLRPQITEPRAKRWRGIVTATLQANYLV